MNDTTIMTSLDTLYDTRLPVFKGMGQRVLEAVLKDDYPYSQLENYKGVDNEDFRKRYAARDTAVLADSTLSCAFNVLNLALSKHYKDNLGSPKPSVPRIMINVYPYDPTDERVEGAIDVLAASIIYEDVILEPFSSSLEGLTNDVLREHKVRYLILYEALDWIEAMALGNILSVKPFHDLKVMAPKIVSHGAPELDHLLKKTNHENPFNSLSLLLSAEFELEFLEAEIFKSSIFEQYRKGSDEVGERVTEIIKEIEE